MKWLLGFFIKGVLGAIAIKSAEKWYVQALGAALLVWSIADLVTLFAYLSDNGVF